MARRFALALVVLLLVAAVAACGREPKIDSTSNEQTAPQLTAEQQEQVDDVERLLQDEIPPSAMSTLAASWIRRDGKVVVAFGGTDALQRVRRDERLSALVRHPAVVLVETKFTADELDAVLERAAAVLNQTVAAEADATRDGWPWAGEVDGRQNVVSVIVDRDLYRDHKGEIDRALSDDVERGALQLDTRTQAGA